MFTRAVVLAFALFWLAGTARADEGLVVSTTAGQIEGITRPHGGASFLGVPYAEPPVAELRWRAPVAHKPWIGVRDATRFASPCIQPDLGWNHDDAVSGQEDCLYLNVVTPVWPAKAPLPVMVWIHGGANEAGTGTSGLFNDGTLADHGVVLVTINYRLGLFGFFAHPELSRESPHLVSGNYGLADQMFALQWVVDNIARFGGDPGNVTVFGHSAGAMDIGLLMTSPAKSLFQKAIAQSGSSLGLQLSSIGTAEQFDMNISIELLGAEEGNSKRAIRYLRQVPAAELMRRLGGSADQPGFGPVVDGWMVPKWPVHLLAAGDEAAIPFLFGTTAREFGAKLAPDRLRALAMRTTGKIAGRVLAAYGLADGGVGVDDPLYGSAADQMIADGFFRCPAVVQGAWHSAATRPTFEYEFDRAIPGQEAAVHATELPYVFGYFPKAGKLAGPFGDIDVKLADLVETYWTNFARTGNPNGEGVPAWPPMGLSGAYLIFAPDGGVATAAGLRKRQCDLFMDSLAERGLTPQ